MVLGLSKKRNISQEDMALALEKQIIRNERLKRLKTGTKKTFKGFDKGGTRVGESFVQFGRAVVQPRQPFSEEQEALSQMFGGGDHIWGTNDSETGVNIHHDLNPRQRGDYGTARMFGF